MAIHSSILAWKIPWTEEPGELQSMGLHRFRDDWETEHITHHIIPTCRLSSSEGGSANANQNSSRWLQGKSGWISLELAYGPVWSRAQDKGLSLGGIFWKWWGISVRNWGEVSGKEEMPVKGTYRAGSCWGQMGSQSRPGAAFWGPAQDFPQNLLKMWEREILIMSIHPTLIQGYSGGVNVLIPTVLCLHQSPGQTLAGILWW